jgi:hypothetical protein
MVAWMAFPSLDRPKVSVRLMFARLSTSRREQPVEARARVDRARSLATHRLRLLEGEDVAWFIIFR